MWSHSRATWVTGHHLSRTGKHILEQVVACAKPCQLLVGTIEFRESGADLLSPLGLRGLSSRILRIRTDYRTPSRPGSPSLTPTTGICLHLIAEQLIPSNLLDSPSYTPSPPLPTLLPAYARPDPSHPRSGYTLPRFGPGSHSPDAGLQVDLLHEAFSWTPVFVATRERGARLPGDNASGPGSLRFRLERARREVGTREELEGESEGEEEGADRRSRTAAMLALFAGRPPRRAWPTVHLFGGEAVERPGAGTGAGAGSELRFRGALRGMHDYAADEESAVVQHVQLPAREPPSPSWPGSDFSDRGRYASHSDGFHIVAVRTVAHSADASRSSGGPGPSTSAEVDPATGTFLRRVGVGRDGGPAVLWHGQAQDPAERPRVAIVRAGGNGADGAGGLILHLQQPLPDDELVSEEVVRTEREDFFPLQPPAGPVTYDEPCTTDAAGEILASHLEGLWVGTYGPHGLEVGHLSVRMDQTGDVGPSGRPIVQRTLSLVKVTGDLNVGSGQISWSAVLDPFELTSPAVPSAGYVGSLEGADLGTVPSVSNETLLRWAASDPAVEGVEQPRWEAGSVPGAGQIALVGFVHRSWTGASKSSMPVRTSRGSVLTIHSVRSRDLHPVNERGFTHGPVGVRGRRAGHRDARCRRRR